MLIIINIFSFAYNQADGYGVCEKKNSQLLLSGSVGFEEISDEWHEFQCHDGCYLSIHSRDQEL